VIQIEAHFPRGWFAPNLPGYRETTTTYGCFDYDELPPLEEKLCGDFAWLTPMDDLIQKEMLPFWEDNQTRDQIAANLEHIISEAKTRGFTLPDSFLRFMRSEALQRRMPSSTACYFDAPERIVEASAPAEGILIRFMNDQQWCILWYLYVEKSGAHAVLASDRALDIDDEPQESENEKNQPSFYMCAQDFEEFIFRCWLENCVWYVLHEKHRPLTAREERYLAHYRK
jgi:hypothetical protein